MIYVYFNQSNVKRLLDGFYYRLYQVEDRDNSRTGFMKTFFENYDYTLFGNGLNTTAFLKQDNMAHSYNDMPAFVHLFNDIGLIPSIVIF